MPLDKTQTGNFMSCIRSETTAMQIDVQQMRIYVTDWRDLLLLLLLLLLLSTSSSFVVSCYVQRIMLYLILTGKLN